MEQKHLLSKEKFEELETELENLKVEGRKEIAAKIAAARAQGDLSENAEYDSAMDEQRDMEARIAELEGILKNYEIIEEKGKGVKKVALGSVVRVYDYDDEDEYEFKLVGSIEADSLNNRISNESPLGKAVLGAKVDDEVMVETESGSFKYKVLEIKKDKK